MTLEEHCQLALVTFGDPFTHVHLWLDEPAVKNLIRIENRRVRHHLKGAREVFSLWGEQAALAALLHIDVELKKQGLEESDSFPENEDDFDRMGFI